MVGVMHEVKTTTTLHTETLLYRQLLSVEDAGAGLRSWMRREEGFPYKKP